MFQSTIAENFHSWENFWHAYYEPIVVAMGSLPFVGKDLAEDFTQTFFVKMYERDLLTNRPVITGRFRNWLYAAARNHAVDEWRKIRRRPDRPDSFEMREPADPTTPGHDDPPFDADEFYALSVLHMTVGRVRKHLLEEGKSEHWMIFEELVLAPMIPGRVPKTRDELLAMFPDQAPVVLDNRVTTVKRVFRRILPALVPPDPTDNLTPEARFQELLEILRASKNYRLWLAFLIDPTPGPEAGPGFSIDLAARSIDIDEVETAISPEIIQDELRILLGFWLEMPLSDYLDDLDGVGPALRDMLRPARHPGRLGRSSSAAPQFNLRGLVDGTNSMLSQVPIDELTALFERLKTFAKRVYRSPRNGREAPVSYNAGRRENSMPFEIAQVLYNLAGALALTRCNARIIGLSDDQYRKNLTWALSQSWLDARLRPVFFAAITQVGRARTP